MSDLYAPPGNTASDIIHITGEEYHHAIRVKRVSHGQTITVTNGVGIRYKAVIQTISDNCISASIIHELSCSELVVPVTLFIAVIRHTRFEVAVEKTTELGVSRIVPIVTERTVIESFSDKRVERLRKIALSAVKQSERAVIPHIDNPVTFEKAIEENDDIKGMAHQGSIITLRSFLEDHVSTDSNRWEKISLLIGPEGGFSPEELSLARKLDIPDFNLGFRKLRTETAAITCMGLTAEWLQGKFIE